MTGPEHYAAADLELERLENDEGDNDALQDDAYRMELLARAQVHATLALAAATADNLPFGPARRKWVAVFTAPEVA
jgi:hypothetical protein